MSRIKLKPWQVHATGVVLCVALTAGAWFVIGRPIMHKYMALGSVRTQWDVHRRRSAELEAERRLLLSELRTSHDELAASALRLQSPDQLNRHIAQITGVAADSGLVLHETGSGALHRTGLYNTIEIRLAGSGSYSNVARFLHRIRIEMPDIGVRSVKLTGNPRSPKAGAQYQLELLWYTAPALVVTGETS